MDVLRLCVPYLCPLHSCFRLTCAAAGNSRRPDLTQTNLVDIYLFRADSEQQILHEHNIINPFGQAGQFNAQVNDSWFGAAGDKWDGSNTSFPFRWVITRSDKGLDGSQISQPIFSAVQTTFADSVIASRSSASAAAASSASSLSVLSSLSSRSAASAASSSSAALTQRPTSTNSSSVQSAGSSSGFPHWAIAVITVLGFLAVASICILAFLIIRRLRRRGQDEVESNRNSMGSSSPMMANAAQQGSPLLGTASLPPPPHSPVGTGSASAAAGVGFAGGAAMSERERNAPSIVLHDGASTTSAGDSAPFSGADAAIMADAFRKMLRKPDFAGRLEEGDDSPDGGDDGDDDDHRHGPTGAGLIGRELAEEGRDIRSVSSERGVRVETGTVASDAGSAALGQRKDTQ
ncbi:hypothetical protein P691DRAFT_802619 [Macrolepiota fuliginosa MF-IS2]|uniref:Uncharacterized protein n=1 Tax=Macrolepiota fuliginosa MF-IS2 TaxID=1400762 RepID=A0A9P6C3B1_9AGAR|nr:hypothetical protein P691DRAFT_802619 [Macrolepiota fuliginosa MF-IS2]